MITIDSKKYSGPCRCGRNHEMATQLVIIQPGCLAHFDTFMADAQLTGKRAAVYDKNTYAAKCLQRPNAQQEIILSPQNLHADEHATAKVLAQLEEDVTVLIAVGSGTIHDVVRYCAHKRGIPFIACPTAATVDGFCSTVSAMTWESFKKTIPGVAPLMVIADTDVLCNAPSFLSLSGVGDILGKYTALADWNIAHLLTGEYLCPVIEDLTRQAVVAVHNSSRKVAARDADAIEQLTYGLLLSGLAMQMMGNSRPASGAEHHISHFVEMEPESLNAKSDALHGEKVGVGTAIVSGVYHTLAKIEDIAPYVHSYPAVTEEFLRNVFGERLVASVTEENQNDCIGSITPELLVQHWPEIRKILQPVPSREELQSLYREIGAKATLEDLGLPAGILPQLLAHSPYVRNRLTMMRIHRMITV